MPCIILWQLRNDSTKSNRSGRPKTFVKSCCCCCSSSLLLLLCLLLLCPLLLLLLCPLLLLLLLQGRSSLWSSDDALPSGQADHLLSASECSNNANGKGQQKGRRGDREGSAGLETEAVAVACSQEQQQWQHQCQCQWHLLLHKVNARNDKTVKVSTRRWRFHSVSLVCFCHAPTVAPDSSLSLSLSRSLSALQANAD